MWWVEKQSTKEWRDQIEEEIGPERKRENKERQREKSSPHSQKRKETKRNMRHYARQ